MAANRLNVHARTDCFSRGCTRPRKGIRYPWVVIGVARADQGYTNPKRRVAVATKHRTVATNIMGSSISNLPRVARPGLRILRWLLNLRNLYTSWIRPKNDDVGTLNWERIMKQVISVRHFVWADRGKNWPRATYIDAATKDLQLQNTKQLLDLTFHVKNTFNYFALMF
jgi:hypothetical protein